MAWSLSAKEATCNQSRSSLDPLWCVLRCNENTLFNWMITFGKTLTLCPWTLLNWYRNKTDWIIVWLHGEKQPGHGANISNLEKAMMGNHDYVSPRLVQYYTNSSTHSWYIAEIWRALPRSFTRDRILRNVYTLMNEVVRHSSVIFVGEKDTRPVKCQRT
jgi:hypothetical protein